MTDGGPHLSAEALRAEFDAGFAEPRRVAPEATALLALRVAGAPFAVRLLEAGGLAASRPIVPVPSRRRELLGVAGLRGEVLPVYSLARLVLGVEDVEAPRWILLSGGPEPVALAFEQYEGHLVARRAELSPVSGGEGAATHVAAVHAGPPPRSVLDLGSVIAAIRASGPAAGRSP